MIPGSQNFGGVRAIAFGFLFLWKSRECYCFVTWHKCVNLCQIMDRWGGGVGAKMPPPWNLSHISYNDETWHNHTFPKGNPKIILITWHTLWALLTPAFFSLKSATFVIFDKHGCNFDRISKIYYSRPSYNNEGNLK